MPTPPSAKPSPSEAARATLTAAHAAGASDVHLVTLPSGELSVRFRVNGTLRDQPAPERADARPFLNAMVALCPSIFTVDHRRPQDGTFTYRMGTTALLCRMTVFPQIDGITVVVRLVRPLEEHDLAALDIPATGAAALTQAVVRPGLAILAGGTGSGRTRTLYAMLAAADRADRAVAAVHELPEGVVGRVTHLALTDAAQLDQTLAMASSAGFDVLGVDLPGLQAADWDRLIALADRVRVIVTVHGPNIDAALARTRQPPHRVEVLGQVLDTVVVHQRVGDPVQRQRSVYTTTDSALSLALRAAGTDD